MKTAIITGISGQDGAYLARLLLSKDFRVIGVIRQNKSIPIIGLDFLGISKNVELKEINLLDGIAVENLIKEYQPDEFYNLAAQSSVGLSFKSPVATFEFNTISTINILEAIKNHSLTTKFYQASSSEMFGNIGEENLPLKESVLFHPASPYGISKASAHWITVNYREAYGVKACCGILFNHESCLRGENFVIKKIIRTGLEIKEGKSEKLKLGELSVQRDWGYAPKFVEAMWLMLQQDNSNDYLICSGNVISLREITEIVFKKLELDFDKYVEIEASLMRNVELDIIYGDNSKAKNELGWNYDISSNQLIEKLIKDEKEFLEWKKK
ncbi:MAG: GDP-mannose 4,6-dehydratase [Flavobacteriales bacterium]|nr:MAG: GDP-mannose 4,6-dehydratase [Flavobacteriales bacterium]